MFNVNHKTVVISGASQGLGYQLANKLHAQGANTILLARSSCKLSTLADKLNSEKIHPDQFSTPYPIDLSISSQVVQFGEYLTVNEIHIDIVICCAGSSIPKLFTDLSLSELDSGIDINYKTCIYLLHTLIPHLKSSPATSGKHIVILSSSVAFYSFIGYSQYAPLKSALKSLSDSLRHELKPFNIKVSTVFPGNFASEGYHEENLSKPLITSEIEGSSTPISVDSCCDIILKQLDSGTTYIHTDFIGYLLNCFSLGFQPRNYWFVQIFFAFFGACFARLVDMYHEYLIQKWFNDQNNDQIHAHHLDKND